MTSEPSRRQRRRVSLRPDTITVGTASFKDSFEIPDRAPGQRDAQVGDVLGCTVG